MDGRRRCEGADKTCVMAIVKANYVRRGTEQRARVKATIDTVGEFPERRMAGMMVGPPGALPTWTRVGLGGALMSLHPQETYPIPEATRRVAWAATRRVAWAAFPKGTLCLRIADTLGTVYRDHQFADLFPRRGQPAVAPARLALATVLQFVEGLSDRQAADAVRGRIDWKYALGLELTDPG